MIEQLVSDFKNKRKSHARCVVGVPASEKIAEKDLKNMAKYKAKITKVGNSKCVDPAVIAGIISRESHAGTVLEYGWGDYGNAFGLMQVPSTFLKTQTSSFF